MSGVLEVRAVANRRDLDRFIKFPWRIYENDPVWVAPLLGDVRRALDPVKHPFHQHADVACFLAWRGPDVVGRIAAIVNRRHNDFYHDTTGFFGLFESVDDQTVANALLSQAEAWLRERGCTTCRGPMNFSTNDELCSPGVLVDGFDTPPMVMMAHTPPYYARLLEAAGYRKEKDLYAYWVNGETTPDRLKQALERLRRNEAIEIRTINLKDFDREVARVKQIYNSAWERNWGFVPMTDAEFDFMAKQLRPIVEPRFVLIGEVKGEPVAFAIELPDLNQAFKHMNGRLFPIGLFKFLWYRRKIDRVRVLTLGVVSAYRGRGIDGLLIGRILEAAQPLGMAKGECSWILEDNIPMRKGLDRVGGRIYKTYRVYEKPLTP
ncbi:MAG TPA: hypothetical protein VK864_21355 [Longimicrobiales bacterium]|nr:hypothetical protein [Longimicrobiales bacterium]